MVVSRGSPSYEPRTASFEVLAMSPEERAQMGLAAAQRVRERYSWDAVTDAYERLFREMLAG